MESSEGSAITQNKLTSTIYYHCREAQSLDRLFLVNQHQFGSDGHFEIDSYRKMAKKHKQCFPQESQLFGKKSAFYMTKLYFEYNYFLNSTKKMKYAVIPNQKRAILLERVLNDKQSIKMVADELKIKFPSAKSIIRTYKKTGRVFNKKKSRKALSQDHSIKYRVSRELCSVEQMLEKQEIVENQEKSQKIQTHNQNEQKEAQVTNLYEYRYDFDPQAFFSYPLFFQAINQGYIQFPTGQYYGSPFNF